MNGKSKEGLADAEFSLSRMLTFKGFRKPARLVVRGVELSTADMRAALARRLTADGLTLRRSADGFLADLGRAPDLLALGPADIRPVSVMQLQLQPSREQHCSLHRR